MCCFSRPKLACSDFANVCNVCRAQCFLHDQLPGTVLHLYTAGFPFCNSFQWPFSTIGSLEGKLASEPSKVKMCWNWWSTSGRGGKEMRSWKHSWKGRKGTSCGAQDDLMSTSPHFQKGSKTLSIFIFSQCKSTSASAFSFPGLPHSRSTILNSILLY